MILGLTSLGAYALARTGFAVPVGMALWQRNRQWPLVAGQAAADLIALLFLLGLSQPGLRVAVHWWWVVLFLYAASWELLRFGEGLEDLMDPLVTEADPGRPDMGLLGLGGFARIIWQVIGVAPPLAAGFLLVFDVVFPHAIDFLVVPKLGP